MAKSRRYFDIVICVTLLVLGFYSGQYLGQLTGYERTRPVQWSQLEQPTIGRLFNDVKVFCWVATYPLSHKTKAHAISVTWGKQCNRIIFVSNGTDDELPIIVVKLNESRSELWSKTRAAFTWIYDNVLDDYEWFLKADDDTYMHMDNLRALLSNYSSSDALAIGHQFKSQDGHPTYHSGGAGYVLSREAVRRLVSEGFTNVSECNKQNHHEDVFIGICLNELNVTVVDGADENGTYRFHVIALYDFLLNRVPDWMKIKSRTEVKKSFACCSPHFISMHYTTADQQYMIDYLTHHLKPYGVQH